MPNWRSFNPTNALMINPTPKFTTLTPQPPRINIPRSSAESTLSSSSPKLPSPSVISPKLSSSSHSRGRSRIRKASSKNSDLTEESLNEFNRRNEVENRKNFISPYYHGLTDSALYLNSLKCLSPGRESHVTTASTFSTVIIKLQQWGSSCFKGKRDSRKSAYGHPRVRPKSLGLEFSKSLETVVNDGFTNQQKEGELEQEEKSLRARVSVMSKVSEDEVSVTNGIKQMIVREGQEQEKKIENISRKENERFIWADKYRPKALNDFICNKAKAEYLHELSIQHHYSHFIFEGPPGVGKRTMVLALLREVFEPDKLETRVEWREFELKGEVISSIKVKTKVSSHHVEMNLSELRGYEKHVILKLIKETQIDQDLQCDQTNNRAIILYQADKLSSDSQQYMRWVMDRYKSASKIFFCCSDVGKLQTVRSLCTIIQLYPPSNTEIVQVLEYIAKQEGIQLPSYLIGRIAEKSKQNLRQAIRSFEASWKLNHKFKEDQVILTGWEEDIANIAKNIIDEQTPKQLYIIRGKLQKLIAHNVSPNFIFITLVGELKKHLKEQFMAKIDSLYLEYTREICCRMDGKTVLVLSHGQAEEPDEVFRNPSRKNSNSLIRIEEFTARFMSLYKSFVGNQQRESDLIVSN